jgi:hypothetical protein
VFERVQALGAIFRGMVSAAWCVSQEPEQSNRCFRLLMRRTPIGTNPLCLHTVGWYSAKR